MIRFFNSSFFFYVHRQELSVISIRVFPAIFPQPLRSPVRQGRKENDAAKLQKHKTLNMWSKLFSRRNQNIELRMRGRRTSSDHRRFCGGLHRLLSGKLLINRNSVRHPIYVRRVFVIFSQNIAKQQ